MTRTILPSCLRKTEARRGTPAGFKSDSLAFLTIALILACSAPSQAEVAELQRLRQENEALRARVQELETRVQHLKGVVEELQTQNRRAEGRARDLEIRNRQVTTEAEAHFVTCAEDADADVTTCRTPLMPLAVTHGRKRHHWFRLAFSHPGAVPASAVKKVSIDFETRASGGIYRSVSQLQLNVDGETIVCPISGYRARRRSAGGSRRKHRRDDESFTATVVVKDLAAIAQGRRVEGRLGAVRFKFEADQIHSCKVVLNKIKRPRQ